MRRRVRPFRLMNGVVVMGSSRGDGSSTVPRRPVRGHRGTLSRGPPAQHRPTGLQPGADVVSGVIRLRGRPDHLGADANMTEADLTGVNLCRADLTGVRWSQETQWRTGVTGPERPLPQSGDAGQPS
ncbi:pentapeptide repeat-containing protein [Streptomyces avidinii]|uniref:pentapeptide repeat-containing protein n=1 Tax=Streptomyces avidinii TaxID=1895 RepID=UPI003865B02E